MNGHWFCYHCNDVVFLPAPIARWEANQLTAHCPQCRKLEARWIPENKTVSPVTAARLFEEMKEAVK